MLRNCEQMHTWDDKKLEVGIVQNFDSDQQVHS